MTATERRIELNETLCNILGSRNVYFQPPESVKMSYPAIVYSLDGIDKRCANNGIYLSERKYLLTLIDKDPDSGIVDKIASLQKCSFNRSYRQDNLNHYVFTIFY